MSYKLTSKNNTLVGLIPSFGWSFKQPAGVMLFMGYDSRNTINSRKRSERLSAANKKGSHTKSEWLEMKLFFRNTCAICFGERGYTFVEMDHIIPLYQGGSNHIRNLQPLCAGCNASKGPDDNDYRPQLAEFLGLTLPDNYKNPF